MSVDTKAEIRLRLDAIMGDMRESDRYYSNASGYIREIKDLLRDL